MLAPTVPEIPIFLNDIWRNALCEGLCFGVRLFEIVCPFKSIPLGRCLLRISKHGPLKIATRPFATHVNMEWFSSVAGNRNFAAFKHTMRSECLLYAELRSHSASNCQDSDLVMDYHQDLTRGDLWSDYSEIVRRNVKKSRKCGHIIDKTYEPDRFYDLLSRQGGRSDRANSGFSREDFRRFLSILNAHDLMDMFFSYNRHGDRDAGHVCLRDGKVAYDILSASTAAAYATGANYHLLHHILGYYSGMGFHTFDHCGANIEGVREFKRRFSPQECYMVLHRFGAPIGLLLQARKWFKR